MSGQSRRSRQTMAYGWNEFTTTFSNATNVLDQHFFYRLQRIKGIILTTFSNTSNGLGKSFERPFSAPLASKEENTTAFPRDRVNDCQNPEFKILPVQNLNSAFWQSKILNSGFWQSLTLILSHNSEVEA